MSYKYVLLILLVSMMLSGCFSTESEPSDVLSNDQKAEDVIAQDTTPALQATPEELPELSPQALLVNSLLAQPDLFVLSKQDMTEMQREYVLTALSALTAQKINEGLAQITAAESLGMLNSNAYVVKADLLFANDDTDNAIEALEQALKVNGYNPKATNRLGAFYREKGEFEKALELYTQAIKGAPTHGPSYRNRGVLNDLYLGDKVAAIEDYQTYQALLEHAHSDTEDKHLKKQMKLVKIWLVDVERQVQALARNENER